MLTLLVAASACTSEREPPPAAKVADAPAPAVAPTPAPQATPESPPPDAASVRAALERLEQQLRPAAGDPTNPWALAHGLLAFGPDFETRSGGAAVAAIMASATPIGPAGARRYRFPRQGDDGTPVDPHPYGLALAMRSAGVPLGAAHAAADGEVITLGRLLTDLRQAPDPDSEPTGEDDDARWHSVAWRLSALALDLEAAETTDVRYDALRARALARLERDVAPFIEARAAPGAFAPRAPMGAAKRGKTHLYGHSCGGLHFLDAVVRSHPATGDAGDTGDTEAAQRVAATLATLHIRFEAEHSLYRSLLRRSPSTVLLLTVQQLKFYGHVLEVLGHAHAQGYRAPGQPGAVQLAALEVRVTTALLEVLTRLDTLGAYQKLDAVRAKREQTYLDLIGDGCHAVAAMRLLLPRLDGD